MIKEYQRQPTCIQAIQLSDDIIVFQEAFNFTENILQRIQRGFGEPILFRVYTLKGVTEGIVGDYLIKDSYKDCYIVRKEVFEKTFESI